MSYIIVQLYSHLLMFLYEF